MKARDVALGRAVERARAGDELDGRTFTLDLDELPRPEPETGAR
ncbi:hypothetical protein [Streptomyces sp. NPDC058664]